MREQDLVACQPRAYRTTTVHEGEPRVADHVGRDFSAQAPGRKLVGDITYVRTWAGWLYLAAVIDCHTKAVIGWSMAEHMRTDLIRDAIDMAATNVNFADGAVFHSDRGSQYSSERFARHLKSHGLTPSIDGQNRRVLGQCHGRKLLRRAEERACVPYRVPHQG